MYNKSGDYYECWICGMYYFGSILSYFRNNVCVAERKRGTICFWILNHPEKYDKANISRDMRNQCFIYFVILSIGAVLSNFISSYIAIPTYIIWTIIFFKSVHLDAEKAFEKYLIH